MNRVSRTATWIFGLALLALPPSSLGQGTDAVAVQQLLGTYREDRAAGVAAILNLPNQRLESYLRACRDTLAAAATGRGGSLSPAPSSTMSLCSRHDVQTFAQVLLDASIQLFQNDPNRAGRLINDGAILLRDFYEAYPDRTSREVDFIARWHAHAIRMLLSQRFLQRAALVLDRTFTWLPDSAELYVTRGTVAEIPLGWIRSNMRGAPVVTDPDMQPLSLYVPPTTTRQGALTTAAAQYLLALRADPTHVWAHLSLAWVQIRNKGNSAYEQIAEALKYATNDDERYVAQLLLGAQAEARKQTPEAVEAYTRARALGPTYQAACTSLAGLYASAGDGTAAARTAVECMAIEPDPNHPDPWFTLRFGITPHSVISWLHDEARRP